MKHGVETGEHSAEKSAEQGAGYFSDEERAREQERESRPGYCAKCNVRAADRSESEHSVLCADCREEQIKFKVPISVKLFLAAALTRFVAAAATLPPVLSLYQVYIDAGRSAEAREYIPAYKGYISVLEKYPASIPIILKAADAAMSAQHFGSLAEILNTYLEGKSLDERNYARAAAHQYFLDDYANTSNEIYNISEETLGSLAPDAAAEEVLPVLSGKLEELLQKAGTDKTLVYFHLGLYSQDQEKSAEYFRLALEQNPAMTYPYSYYGTALRRSGKLDEAETAYRDALELNASDALSLRGLSVLQLLEGEKGVALETVRRAYELEPEGLYVADTLIVALCENGLREEAEALLKNLENGEDYILDEGLKDYMDGNVGLEQYYLG
jgi:tetratricopeptide (TPR) repeat protein